MVDDCTAADCGTDATFVVYDPATREWYPCCDRHARHLHPSLELHAWLESGYMKPIEVDTPDGPPADPRGGRALAFKTEIETLMEWTDATDAPDGSQLF